LKFSKRKIKQNQKYLESTLVNSFAEKNFKHWIAIDVYAKKNQSGMGDFIDCFQGKLGHQDVSRA
jgi:hypothetical protein